MFLLLGGRPGFGQIDLLMLYPVLITCAVPEELAPFISRFRSSQHLRIAGRRLIKGRLQDNDPEKEIYVLFTGMGGRVAESALRAVLEKIHPGQIIISGTAGGLIESITPGDIVIGKNFGEEKFQSEVIDALKLAGSDVKIWWKNIYTAQTVLSGPTAKKNLAETSGADAVDMESADLAQIAQEKGIPFIVLRGISDGLYDEMPLPFERFLKEDGFLSLPRLVFYLLTHPWKIPVLMGFAHKVRRACEKLGMALENLFLSRA